MGPARWVPVPVTTPDEGERAVTEQRRAGYGFVKLHGDLSRESLREAERGRPPPNLATER